MGERTKTLALIALIGFIVGVIVPIAFENIPLEYLSYLTAMVQVKWILSGIAGAFLAMIIAVILAYSTGKKTF